MSALGQSLFTTSVPAFDAAAADAAARQLELTAQSIAEALAVLRADIRVVRHGWEGPHRSWFDAAAIQALISGATWVQVLSDLAVAVRAKALEAEAAQRAADKQRATAETVSQLVATTRAESTESGRLFPLINIAPPPPRPTAYARGIELS